MAEYIDREELLKHYIALVKMDCNNKVSPPSWSYAYESFIDQIAELPTADVVPKSEVEKLEQDVTRLVQEKDALIKNYAECMKNYVREIFEEVEDLLHKHYVEWDFCYFDDYLSEDFDKLKEKYTESEDNGGKQ